MRVGHNIQAVQINSCPNEFYWYNNHIGLTVNVADSGEDGEWYIVTGEHLGKHVAKSSCSFVEMTLIDMTVENKPAIEQYRKHGLILDLGETA
jgi:hypothetical protein